MNFENAVSMNGLFYYCASLSCLTLPQTNFSFVTDMYSTFKGCLSLRFDCSDWDAPKGAERTDFNYDAPGVIPPKVWQ